MSEEDKREAGSPARGGARTGAGRPKGSGTYSEVRSVRLRPDEAEHCRRKGGNRYLRGLIRADMTREEAPEGRTGLRTCCLASTSTYASSGACRLKPIRRTTSRASR